MTGPLPTCFALLRSPAWYLRLARVIPPRVTPYDHEIEGL